MLGREIDSIPLVAGLNVHTWCGPEMPVAEATSGLPLRIAYGWDLAEASLAGVRAEYSD